MSIIAEFSVPSDQFALATALSAAPGTRIEAERLATHSQEWVMPFIWADGEDVEAFDAALADDPTIEDATVVESMDDTRLFMMRWAPSFEDLINEIIDRHGVLREAFATDGEWYLKLLFVEQSDLSEFRDYFGGSDEGFSVRRIHEPTEAKRNSYGLTAEQYETLLTALRLGYFSVPRQVTIDDLADELGVSTNAVSQRLRRAHESLVRHALEVDGHHLSD